MPKPKHRLLLIEPYCGGSHRAFLDGLQASLELDCTRLWLPPRKWKMRMQLAAFWAAERIAELAAAGSRFDAALCSTFIDTAVLRAQLCRRGIHLPLAIYFHENQFSYPGQIEDPGRHQFTAINFASALAADSLAFNSRYNLETFLTGVRRYLKKAADLELGHLAGAIEGKARVLYPGLDFTAIDEAAPAERGQGPPVIVWNHRWEHDKDPETFFQALFELSEADIDFGLIVLGEHFANQPEIFSRAREKLARHILHFGYTPDHKAYAYWIKRGDIVISTARQEFFGMAVLEAVRAGCRPLVPDRLVYRELYPAECRYKDGRLAAFLKTLLEKGTFSNQDYTALTDRFAWPVAAEGYCRWLMPLFRIPWSKTPRGPRCEAGLKYVFPGY